MAKKTPIKETVVKDLSEIIDVDDLEIIKDIEVKVEEIKTKEEITKPKQNIYMEIPEVIEFERVEVLIDGKLCDVTRMIKKG